MVVASVPGLQDSRMQACRPRWRPRVGPESDPGAFLTIPYLANTGPTLKILKVLPLSSCSEQFPALETRHHSWNLCPHEPPVLPRFPRRTRIRTLGLGLNLAPC